MEDFQLRTRLVVVVKPNINGWGANMGYRN
jgi:hypothetical protein